MRQVILLLSGILMLVLSSCASAPTQTGKMLQPSNTTSLESHVKKKISGRSQEELTVINELIDHVDRARHSGEELLTMRTKDGEWPYFLEGVMRSNIYLNALPRDKKRLIFRESKRMPNVVNVFYLVKAENIPTKGQHPLNWFPGAEVWNKYFNNKANNLTELTARQAYLTLFAEANNDHNPELILAVKGADEKWDWSRMLHPEQTITKEMAVPLLTVKNAAMALLLSQ